MVVFDEMKSNVQGETFPQIASNSVKQTPSRPVWNIPVQVYDLDWKVELAKEAGSGAMTDFSPVGRKGGLL